jgi:hypothetical protein
MPLQIATVVPYYTFFQYDGTNNDDIVAHFEADPQFTRATATPTGPGSVRIDTWSGPDPILSIDMTAGQWFSMQAGVLDDADYRARFTPATGEVQP